jgi:hypothetical protein
LLAEKAEAQIPLPTLAPGVWQFRPEIEASTAGFDRAISYPESGFA